MPHEVLTLQLGSFANYVGTHYWNFQDELLGLQEREDAVGAAAAQIDSGVLYRAGETARGQPTFTPRLVAWDLSGALGGASSRGSLYLEEGHLTAAGTWAGRHEVHRALPVARSAFSCALEQEPEGPPPPQAGNVMATAAGVAAAEALAAAARALDGEGAVRYWTDYLKAHLHPRSLHQLPGVWEGGAPFDGWGDGAAYAASAERREGMLEAVRFFAEEADSLQGLQLFVDDLSGFGAIAARLLPELREDLGPSLPVLLYAVRPSAAEPPGLELAALRRRRLGEALSLARLSQHASVATVVAPPATPTALPLLRWLPERPFHTSALCAAALDTATLPYRLAPGDGSPVGIGRMDMWSLSQLLTAQHNTPLAALAAALPCPSLPADVQRKAEAADARVAHAAEQQQQQQQQPSVLQCTASLTPGITAGDPDKYAECVVLRGARSDARCALELPVAASALDAALAAERQRCVRTRMLAAAPLHLPLPFPQLFKPCVSPDGDVLGPADALREPAADVASCPLLTRLSGSTAFAPTIEHARQAWSACARSAQGGSILQGWGLDADEHNEVDERLEALASAYVDEE